MSKYPFAQMPIGRCAFYKVGKEANLARTYACKIGVKMGRVFRSSTIQHTTDYSVVCIQRVA